MNDRKRGPVETLCREIGFRFSHAMESPRIFVAFVSVLVTEVGDMRKMQASLAEAVTTKAPSSDSAEVLRRVNELLSITRPAEMIERAATVHGFIHEVAPDDARPCDHLIDMLSSCVSAVRFGLEIPCHSRHAAEAASHIWKHRYGISLFDEFTSNWKHDWTRAKLQEAILGIALHAFKAD